MLKKFGLFIHQNRLCTVNDRILIAVSGGVDSVVLLHLFVNAGYKTAFVHCNFGLRGEESNEDEKFVRQLSNRYGLKIFVKNCDAGSYSSKNRVSIQEAARTLRYRFFEELIQKEGFDKVATGHNQDDNVESFFINLSRVSGLKGLTGIPVQRSRFIRPLLFASRNEIVEYARQEGLRWREDSSNASDKYLRNRIRHHLVPQLNQWSEKFIPALVGSMQHLTDAENLFAQLLSEKRTQLFTEKNGQWVVDIERLMLNPQPDLLLFYLLRDFGFDKKEVARLYEAIRANFSGRQFFSTEYHLLLDRHRLLLVPRETNPERADESVEIGSFEEGLKSPVHLEFIKKKNHRNFLFKSSKNRAYFDAEKLALPLVVRRWKKGDRFRPFGMRGTKLVSDLLIDEKFSLFEKKNVRVLLSAQTILWVIGIRSSEALKVTAQTKEIVEIKYLAG